MKNKSVDMQKLANAEIRAVLARYESAERLGALALGVAETYLRAMDPFDFEEAMEGFCTGVKMSLGLAQKQIDREKRAAGLN